MRKTDDQPQVATQAVSLALVITRLRARIRAEAGVRSTGLPVSQLAVLKRVLDEGPTTAASLAAAEYVSQQAIAQSLAALKERGLVRAKSDPNDGRKTLVSVTAAGRRLVESLHASREAWLIRAIEASIGVDERAELDKAIELLERIGDADLRPGVDIR